MTTRSATMQTLRPLVADRARGVCEAGDRCGFAPSELHHVLPRSRARRGDVHLLDEWATDQVRVGETPDMPWLRFLCHRCHVLAHGNPKWARTLGLLVDGSVTAKDGRPVYTGTYPPLLEMFGGDR